LTDFYVVLFTEMPLMSLVFLIFSGNNLTQRMNR